MTSAEGKEVILNGWKTAGKYDTIRFGTGKLSAMDLYQDTYHFVNESNILVATNLEAVC